jgi:hypothetical protein
MDRKFINMTVERTEAVDAYDLDDLLHPAQAFEHPMNIVHDPDLTLSEQRAISWASDACAVEAAPTLRRAGSTSPTVQFDDVMDALRALDRQQADAHKVLEERRPGVFGRRRQGPSAGDQGPALN